MMQAGARSPFANVIVASVIMLVLSSLAKQLEYIPKVRGNGRRLAA